MKSKFTTLLTVLLITGIYLLQAFAQDVLKLDSEPLEINVVAVKTNNSFPVYVGSGTEISLPSSPMGGGMPMISFGGGSTHLAGKIEATAKGTVLAMVVCRVSNISKTIQSFQVGDISMRSGKEQTDFMAVGLGDYVFAKDKTDREKVKKKEIKIEPSGKFKYLQIIYVFPVLKDSPSWRLTYKGNKGVELKGKEKKTE